MTSRTINTILIVVIIAIIGAMGFFGFRALKGGQSPQEERIVQKTPEIKPQPVTNRGKASEEHDAMFKTDVQKINDAVVLYAKDHQGAYPKSDVRNPCTFTEACLKGVDINTKQKAYLDPIPQFGSQRADYYYSADNAKKRYCVRTSNSLETEIGKLFQCTQEGCGSVSFEEACR